MIRVPLTDQGAGPALVFLHGAGVDADMWAPQAGVFAKTHRVICATLPGHGGAGPVRDGVPGMAEDVTQALTDAGVTRFALVGLSLGGMVALELAARWPDRVSHLVIAESVPYVAKTAPGRAIGAVFVGFLWLVGPGFFRMLPDSQMGAETAAAGAYVKGVLGHMSRADLYDVLSAAMRYDGRPHLDGIAQPTLVMVGEKNGQTHARARFAADRIPGARFHVIRGAGHIANMDAPEEFNAQLKAFLEVDHDTASASSRYH